MYSAILFDRNGIGKTVSALPEDGYAAGGAGHTAPCGGSVDSVGRCIHTDCDILGFRRNHTACNCQMASGGNFSDLLLAGLEEKEESYSGDDTGRYHERGMESAESTFTNLIKSLLLLLESKSGCTYNRQDMYFR